MTAATNPAVSVGVPVFNGAAYLAECLECLRTQTFKDIEVLIFDNASTDATADIAAEFCTRDPRFRLTRQKENVGPTGNFLSALEAARAPYFMWRAHDDLSDARFIEVLYNLLSGNPKAHLAVSTVSTIYIDGTRPRLAVFPVQSGYSTLMDTTRLLFGSHASWFYGLWRRDALEEAFPKILGVYAHPHMWGSDHLTLFPSLLRGAVVGSNDVRFIQRIRRRPKTVRRQSEDVAEMMRVRRQFRRACYQFLDECRFPGLRRAVYRGAIWIYAGRCTYRLTKVIRRTIQSYFRAVVERITRHASETHPARR